ncbi:hypothetical protein DENIS_0024 [Desulfonema ishimotonii]|uniref:Uncharacterized protein n=1 Tax=Desulfonema ishimotonii TaxID=45657 RepID=A0A401FQ32_9BACT|nr:hypothetical protein DENIS_0024 [Desulfonema ishimotonii]
MRKLRPEAGFSQLLQKIAPPGLNFCTPKKKLPAGKLFHAESFTVLYPKQEHCPYFVKRDGVWGCNIAIPFSQEASCDTGRMKII